MKAEERHRLDENELERLTERARPALERYGTTILLALAALLVVAAIVVAVKRFSGSGETAAWSQLATAFSGGDAMTERLAAVVDDHPDSPAAPWARLMEADMYLQQGASSIVFGREREAGLKTLADAREAYEKLLERPGLTPDVRVRALWGLGRTLEMVSAGKLDPARERYQQIVKEYPDSAFAPLAEERLDSLKDSDTAAFYRWLSEQRSTPLDLNLPADLRGGQPESGPMLPPDFSAPEGSAAGDSSVDGSPAVTAPGDGATADGAPADGATSTDTAKPVEAPMPATPPAAPADAATPAEPTETESAETESAESPANP